MTEISLGYTYIMAILYDLYYRNFFYFNNSDKYINFLTN